METVCSDREFPGELPLCPDVPGAAVHRKQVALSAEGITYALPPGTAGCYHKEVGQAEAVRLGIPQGLYIVSHGVPRPGTSCKSLVIDPTNEEAHHMIMNYGAEQWARDGDNHAVLRPNP